MVGPAPEHQMYTCLDAAQRELECQRFTQMCWPPRLYNGGGEAKENQPLRGAGHAPPQRTARVLESSSWTRTTHTCRHHTVVTLSHLVGSCLAEGQSAGVGQHRKQRL